MDFFTGLRDNGVATKTGTAYMVGNVGVEIHALRPDYKEDVLNILRQKKHQDSGLQVEYDQAARIYALYVNGHLVGAVQDD